MRRNRRFQNIWTSTNLDSRQIYFVNQIVEYIVQNGMMKDLSVLQDSPFTDQGSIVDVFTDLICMDGDPEGDRPGECECGGMMLFLMKQFPPNVFFYLDK